MAVPAARVLSFREREAGSRRTGTVELRDFDTGIIETLGARKHEVNGQPGYYLAIEGIHQPPGMPGVPVVFGNPDPAFENYLLPMVMVVRDDISPALARWHPGALQYRAPKPGAPPVAVAGPGGTTLTGWPRMVEAQQAVPYDLSYTLTVYHERRGLIQRLAGNALLRVVMKVYQPRCTINVFDSLGDRRIYFAAVDAAATNDELIDVADRTVGWTMGITVEAELDLNDEYDVPMVTGRQITTSNLSPAVQVARFRRSF